MGYPHTCTYIHTGTCTHTCIHVKHDNFNCKWQPPFGESLGNTCDVIASAHAHMCFEPIVFLELLIHLLFVPVHGHVLADPDRPPLPHPTPSPKGDPPNQLKHNKTNQDNSIKIYDL